MDYTTQMDAARKGIITREMELVARKEKRTSVGGRGPGGHSLQPGP